MTMKFALKSCIRDKDWLRKGSEDGFELELSFDCSRVFGFVLSRETEMFFSIFWSLCGENNG